MTKNGPHLTTGNAEFGAPALSINPPAKSEDVKPKQKENGDAEERKDGDQDRQG